MRSAPCNSGPGVFCAGSQKGLLFRIRRGFEDGQLWSIQAGLTEGKGTKTTAHGLLGQQPSDLDRSDC